MAKTKIIQASPELEKSLAHGILLLEIVCSRFSKMVKLAIKKTNINTDGDAIRKVFKICIYLVN